MNPQDRSDIAALYALGALDEREQCQFEQQLESVPELAAELTVFQSTVAVLGYAAPPVLIANDLRDRLFQRIAAQSKPLDALDLAPLQSTSDDSLQTLLEQADRVIWQPYAFSSGTMLGTLRIDTETNQIHCFVRAEANTRFPLHRHAKDEEIIVLKGDLSVDGKLYGSGDRIYSTLGTAHQPETQAGCLLFLRTSLDDEILSQAF
jgi:anti-sigma factor ChrR (cupin superfamily)